MIMTNTEMKLKETKLLAGSQEEKLVLRKSLILTFFVFILDQVTKYLTIYYLGPIEQGKFIEISPGFFNIVYVHNNGAAWNIFPGQTFVLLAISIVAFLGIFYFLRYLTEGCVERYYALFAVAGGILGNTSDRIWNNGNVIDFLDFNLQFSDWSYHWPAFNIADSAICVGAVIYLISTILRKEEVKVEVTEDGKDLKENS